MEIEPSSQSHYVVERTDDKNGDRPKPSNLSGSKRKNRCQCSVLLVTTSAWHEPMSESWVAGSDKISLLRKARFIAKWITSELPFMTGSYAIFQ